MELHSCPSFPGYSVTANGDVFSHHKRVGLGPGRGSRITITPEYRKQLKAFLGQARYFRVGLSTDKGPRPVAIHTLLLDAFVGPRPTGMETRHLDGNPHNNALSNLCYGSSKANAADCRRHGRDGQGERNVRAKLSAQQVLAIRLARNKGKPGMALAQEYGMAESTISDIITGKTWKHLFGKGNQE